jgi:hypothetical protein
MLHRVIWYKFADVSDMFVASIIRATALIASTTSETSLSFFQTTQCDIPEDSQL